MKECFKKGKKHTHTRIDSNSLVLFQFHLEKLKKNKREKNSIKNVRDFVIDLYLLVFFYIQTVSSSAFTETLEISFSHFLFQLPSSIIDPLKIRLE